MHLYGYLQKTAISKEKWSSADNNDFSILFLLYTVSIFINEWKLKYFPMGELDLWEAAWKTQLLSYWILNKLGASTFCPEVPGTLTQSAECSSVTLVLPESLLATPYLLNQNLPFYHNSHWMHIEIWETLL